jgi:hypothetical protein
MACVDANYSNLRMRDLVWTRLAQDCDNKRAFVNGTMNLPGLLHAGKLLIS